MVVHESAAVIELIEQALSTDGALVLGTTNSLEALDIVRRVAIDLVLLDDAEGSAQRELVGRLRAVQPSVRVLLLQAEPVSLSELGSTVAAALDR